LFVRERATGLTTRVSVSSTGAQGDRHSGPDGPNNSLSGFGQSLAISVDGAWVAFESRATQLVTPPPPSTLGNDPVQVYLHDRGVGTTVLVGRDASGQDLLNAQAPIALIEPGPRVIVIARPTSGSPHGALSWDPSGTRTLLVGETWSTGTGLISFLAVSRDGSRIVSRGALPNDPLPLAVIHHPPAGPTLVGSLNDQGELPSSGWLAHGTALSPDGRWLAWVHDAPNVVANDTNGVYDVFLTDLGPWTSLGGARATAPPTGTLNATNFGPPVLWGVGDLDPTRTSWLTVQRGPLSALGLLSVSTTSVPITAGGATLLAWPPGVLMPFVTSASGTAALPYVWPGGMPGVALFVQAGFEDPLSPGALAVTNGLRVLTPP
jgi:hypothetical protein